MKNKGKDAYVKYARVLPAIVAMILPCISTIYFIYHIPCVKIFFMEELNDIMGGINRNSSLWFSL